MRKFLITAAIALFAFASCQKDNHTEPTAKGEEVSVSIGLALPNAADVISRSSSDKGGLDASNWDAAYTLRYKIAIYEGTTLVRALDPVYVYHGAASAKKAVNARLISGKTYRFVVWADFVDYNADESSMVDKHYNTSDLTNISIKEVATSYTVNDESRDAYFINQEEEISASRTIALTLKRPFSKVRVVTEDVADVYALANVNSATAVKKILFSYEAPIYNVFNALSGEVNKVGDYQPVNINANITEDDGAKATLFWDYVFVKNPEKVNFKFTVNDIGVSREFNTNNIPIERNRLTTVRGNLLTNNANIIIDVDGDFTGEIDDNITNDLTIEVPEGSAATPITYRFTGNIADNVTVKFVDVVGVPYAGTVNIIVEKPTQAAFVIELPNASVYLQGSVGNIIATTKDDTFSLLKGATVKNLTIEKGSANLYGTVTGTVTNNGTGKIMLAVGPNSDRPVSETVIYEALAVVYADGIIFTEGKYPVVAPATPSGMGVIHITKDGYKLVGEENAIIYGAGTQPTSGQEHSLLYVTAENVTMDGLTIMPLTHTVRLDGSNNNIGFTYKGIEVTKPGFTMKNCTLTPNTLTAGSLPNDGGGVFFDCQTAGTMTFENNRFNKVAIYLWSNPSGLVVNIKNNVFDGLRQNGWFSNYFVSSTNWGSVSPFGSVVNVYGNTFSNVKSIEEGGSASLRVSSGKLDIKGNTFPTTNGTYWTATGDGNVYLENTLVPYVAPADFATVISNASAGDKIYLRAEKYDVGTSLDIDQNITIVGGGATISANSPADRGVVQGKNPVIYIKSGAEVIIKDAVISGNQTPGHTAIDGVTVSGSSKLTLSNVTFDGITNAGGPNGVQYGRCVTALDNSELSIADCTFKSYNKNGVHVMGASKASIAGCTFIGNKLSGINGQNGVVFMRNASNSASGAIKNCSFSDLIYDGSTACAVLVYDDTPGDGQVIDQGGNTYSNNDKNWYEGI